MKNLKWLLLLLFTCILSCNVSKAETNTGYIIIGDSRTVGMSKAVKEESNVFFVAECSKGYDWFCKEAVYEVNDIISSNKYANWKIISSLGVNDLGNIDKYEQKYKELLQADWKDFDFYITSVTCVDRSKYTGSVTNSKIQEFNKQIGYYKNYIDLYDLSVDIIQSNDGLHYNNETYRELYKQIMNELK